MSGLARQEVRGLATHRTRALASRALAAVSSWLVEPAAPASGPVVAVPAAVRPVIAVFGLARGCGVTVVSRALAAELATRDAAGAAAVHCEARASGIPLATQSAARLARALAELPGAETRAVGRLCLVGGADRSALADGARQLAPLLLDAGSSAIGGAAAAVADRIVLVAVPSIEPALAAVAADCLARVGHQPLVVLNRADPEEPGGWAARGVHPLPDSRMGAQLAVGGREPRGQLGRAIAELADLCEGRP
jgi:hypothetical protein